MKIVIITNGNLPSYVGLHTVLKEHKSEIARIFITKKVPGQKNKFRGLINILKKTGINYTFFKITYNIFLPKIFALMRTPCRVKKLAEKLDISYSEVKDINDEKNVGELKGINPNVIISFSATQKFTNTLINSVSSMIINVHFSSLPEYGGLSPYIWQLINNEKKAGVTIHKIVPALDEGPIIRQEYLDINPKTSVLKLLINQSFLASKMLPEVLMQLKGGEVKLVEQDLSKKTYFSHPGRAELKKLYANGFKLININDFFYILKMLRNINKNFEIRETLIR